MGVGESRSFFDRLDVSYAFKTICLLTRVHHRRRSERDDAPHEQADRNRGEEGPSLVRRSRKAEKSKGKVGGSMSTVHLRAPSSQVTHISSIDVEQLAAIVPTGPCTWNFLEEHAQQ